MLNRIAREGFSETLTFKQTPEGHEEFLVQASGQQALWAMRVAGAEVLRLAHMANSRHSRRPVWLKSMSKEG